MRIRERALQACLLFLLALGSAAAQAPIDPSLPEAPLSHGRELFLAAGYGVVMNPNQSVPPLSTKQKYKMAFLETVDPSSFLRAGFGAGYDKVVGAGPDYGPGIGGFSKLYAYNFANSASTNFFSDAFIPSLVHQDPRFFRRRTGSAKSRILWVIRSQFVAFSDSGKSMPNYGNIIGFPMATALSVAYLPAENVSFGQTMEGIAIKFGISAGFDTSSEFGGLTRILKVVTRRK